MHITPDLIDSLMYRSEGADLDFKQAQYPVLEKGATEEKRSELLKDLLAMANSWREGPAYILVGFKEAKPSLPMVTGIDGRHLDDAVIQQFIGSKVHPTLEFSYQELNYKGQHIGVFVIPKQARPFYIKSKYGKVQSNVVYVRRGSSTSEAEPPEAIKMHLADTGAHKPASITLDFVDKNAVSLTQHPAPQLKRLLFENIKALPDYTESTQDNGLGFHFNIGLNHVNRGYWREQAKYLSEFSGSVRGYVQLLNRSTFALSDCKLQLSARLLEAHLHLKSEREMPDRPKKDDQFAIDRFTSVPDMLQAREEKAAFQIRRTSSDVCIINIAKLLPGDSFIAPRYLALFPACSGTIKLSGTLYASELKEPMTLEFELPIDVTDTVANIDTLDNSKSHRLVLQIKK